MAWLASLQGLFGRRRSGSGDEDAVEARPGDTVSEIIRTPKRAGPRSPLSAAATVVPSPSPPPPPPPPPPAPPPPPPPPGGGPDAAGGNENDGYDPAAELMPPPPAAHGADVASAAHVASEEAAERGAAWRVLLRVRELRGRFSDGVYMRLAMVPSPHAKNIKKDVRRTFPTHEFFAASPAHRAALHRIITAYSTYDSGVGYSQGMAFVAGYLLMHMSEEDAFFSLVQLMSSRKHNLRELFSGTSPLLSRMLAEFDRQLGIHMPTLAAHLGAQGIDASMYAAPWFLTLFIYRFPPECLPVIWDRFVRHGVRVVFQVGLVILAHYHAELMALDHERILPFFNNLEPIPEGVLRKSSRILTSGADLARITALAEDGE